MPRNHPTVQAVISDPRSFLAKAEKTAAAHPGDLNAWDLFGDVALQASAFDLSYYDKAEKAYGHALAIDPNDPRALKGMGNINYDRHRYDAASSFYERYLRPRPNDARVLTDLGTLHLAKQNIDEALRLYDRALALEPDLFAARFNIAVAHLLRGDKARAVENLIQAHKIAPDASAKLKIEVILARLEGHTYASTAVTPTDDNPPMTFRDAVERVVRTLPSEGSKVRSLEWPSQYKAIVLVSDFAGAMPAAEKARLLHNLKAGIITAKVAHKVSDAVEIDLRDAATGRTVATVID